MKTIGKWIKAAVQHVCDPDRDERIQELAVLLHQGLHNAGKKFSIKTFAEHVGCTDRELEIAKHNVYRKIVERAWKDDKVTANEQNTLRWVTERLSIPTDEAKSLHEQLARSRFAAALSRRWTTEFLRTMKQST